MLRLANRDVTRTDNPGSASWNIVLPASRLCQCGWNLCLTRTSTLHYLLFSFAKRGDSWGSLKCIRVWNWNWWLVLRCLSDVWPHKHIVTFWLTHWLILLYNLIYSSGLHSLTWTHELMIVLKEWVSADCTICLLVHHTRSVSRGRHCLFCSLNKLILFDFFGYWLKGLNAGQRAIYRPNFWFALGPLLLLNHWIEIVLAGRLWAVAKYFLRHFWLLVDLIILMIVNELNHHLLDLLHFFLRSTATFWSFLLIIEQVLKLILRIHHFVLVKVVRSLKQCVRAVSDHLPFILVCFLFKAQEWFFQEIQSLHLFTRFLENVCNFLCRFYTNPRRNQSFALV